MPTYVVIALLWGSIFALSTVALDSFTAVGLTVVRLVAAAVTLVAASLVTRTAFPPRRYWWPIFVNAALVITVPWFLLTLALGTISYTLTSILASAIPLFTLIVVLLAYPEERPTRRRMLGLGVGFVGLLIATGIWSGPAGSQWLGVLMCVVANVSWASSFPYARRHLTGGPNASTLSALALGTGTFVAATIQGVPFAFLFDLTVDDITARTAVAAIVVGAVCGGVGYMLSFRLLRLVDTTTASTISYAVPVVAITLGILLLGEHLTWNEPVGVVLVFFGAGIAQGLIRGRRAPRRA